MTPTPHRVAAIVPAAGESRRMGQPKLLLEFEGRPLIARVVASLIEGGARPVIVVSPPVDSQEGPAVIQAASSAGAVVVTPETRPAEMRDSVEAAVAELKRVGEPPHAILLVPADSPRLESLLVARILEAWRKTTDRIVIPTADGRRGHPIVIPWHLVEAIQDLPADVGINALIADHADEVLEIEVATDAVVTDLDTPEDLQRLLAAKNNPTRSVRLFAIARERMGRGEIEVELPEGATVGELRLALVDQFPELAAIATRVMIAVDSEYADDALVIPSQASLALIPPVSGG